MNNVNLTLLLEHFSNPYTLNIFCDASTSIMRNGMKCGCYGVVAVCGNNVIDEFYRVVSDSTSNESEIKGIRGALILANKYKYNFKHINIFSDSIYSIDGLRTYIYNWKYDKQNDILYTKNNKKPVSNQSIFIECFDLLNQLKQTNIVNLYHQRGHIKYNPNNLRSIIDARNSFKLNNNISKFCKIDLNFIIYISNYNNYVDSNSRSRLSIANIYDNFYADPVTFSINGRNIYKNEK